jgi:tRNA uridine 5-carboxymethylaminomethyl modification enzyme
MDHDIVVIGAGHAGCEAALAAARMGLRTAILAPHPERVAFMPCNPAIGGLGKGHLVREIDALGGQMGRAIDAAGIQFRILNRSKGPAVWGPRAQADKALYTQVMRHTLEAQPRLEFVPAMAVEFVVEPDGRGGARFRAVRTDAGTEIAARAVVATTGTFLRGLLHVGSDRIAGGRSGEAPSRGLSESLRALGLRLGRLKTGTPPRLLRDSIDLERFPVQLGDEPPRPFSHATARLDVEQVPCWLAHTTEDAHAVVRANLHRAPMYNGQIAATGPRYCPSIEDKVVRFADRERHHLFLEPEGRNSPEIYVNGLSTSLPRDVQRKMVHCIPGLEAAEIARWGYAVEYDYVPTDQLDDTLQVRGIAGLYLAGQINGTSGYEEAAAQGLLAGINAAARLLDMPPLVLQRSEAYIGVLVDDLAHRTLVEPYRMFTSRAEFRLVLRCDNADERLMPYAERYGLLADDVRRTRERDAVHLARLVAGLARRVPADAAARIAARTGVALGSGSKSIEELMRTPGIGLRDLEEVLPEARGVRAEVTEKLEVRVKYAGYVRRQEYEVRAARQLESRALPEGLDYGRMAGLSTEAAEKLGRWRPRDLAQASRLDGVRAADLSLLLVHLQRMERQDAPLEEGAPGSSNREAAS